MKLVRRSEDFGQTLGVWVRPGPYVVLPFMGPSSLRDGVGLPLDHSLALALIRCRRYLASALQLINLRADLLATTQLLNGVSLDRYSFVRDATFRAASTRCTTATRRWRSSTTIAAPAAPPPRGDLTRPAGRREPATRPRVEAAPVVDRPCPKGTP